MIIRQRFLLMIMLCLFWMADCANPKQSAAARPEPVPDVLIMVLSGVLPSPYDGISITYNNKTSKDQALLDLKTLMATGGWQAKENRISTLQGITSSEFQALGVVKWDQGILQIEPFVRTFKRYRNIKLLYIVKGAFPFRSLRDYSDKYVDITFIPGHESYTYTIKVKNPNFERLNLPIIVAPEPPKSGVTSSAHQKPTNSNAVRWFIALVVAVVVGIIVFMIVNRISKLRKE